MFDILATVVALTVVGLTCALLADARSKRRHAAARIERERAFAVALGRELAPVIRAMIAERAVIEAVKFAVETTRPARGPNGRFLPRKVKVPVHVSPMH